MLEEYEKQKRKRLATMHGGFTEDIRKNILNNEDSYNAK